MKRILFICHGNICRSPAAEMVMRTLMPECRIDSAATTTDELGHGIYPPMRRVLEERGIPMVPHAARQTSAADYEQYDYIISMDEENRRDLKRIYHGDPEGKVSLLLEWAGEDREVSDPWYTRNFDQALDDILQGCAAMAEQIRRKR